MVHTRIAQKSSDGTYFIKHKTLFFRGPQNQSMISHNSKSFSIWEFYFFVISLLGSSILRIHFQDVKINVRPWDASHTHRPPLCPVRKMREAPGGVLHPQHPLMPCHPGTGGLGMRPMARGSLRARTRRHGRPWDAHHARRLSLCPAPKTREATGYILHPWHPLAPFRSDTGGLGMRPTAVGFLGARIQRIF